MGGISKVVVEIRGECGVASGREGVTGGGSGAMEWSCYQMMLGIAFHAYAILLDDSGTRPDDVDRKRFL